MSETKSTLAEAVRLLEAQPDILSYAKELGVKLVARKDIGHDGQSLLSTNCPIALVLSAVTGRQIGFDGQSAVDNITDEATVRSHTLEDFAARYDNDELDELIKELFPK